MSQFAYYNEIDPYPLEWLENLRRKGLIPDGEIDSRSIADVEPGDLASFSHCHFFAGFGGWARALQLAGWPLDRPVWTGSCPCQPFSNAGKLQGTNDARHLWPEWSRLISECRPPDLFGEQVDAAIRLGWLDAVFDDLENCDYACGSATLPAYLCGAPHIRQRIWFVARRLADPDYAGPQRPHGVPERPGEFAAGPRGLDFQLAKRRGDDTGADPVDGPWGDADWLRGRDGWWRPVEPGTFPLAHGIPGRVGRLRAYGNTIVPQVAATFIRATM